MSPSSSRVSYSGCVSAAHKRILLLFFCLLNVTLFSNLYFVLVLDQRLRAVNDAVIKMPAAGQGHNSGRAVSLIDPGTLDRINNLDKKVPRTHNSFGQAMKHINATSSKRAAHTRLAKKEPETGVVRNYSNQTAAHPAHLYNLGAVAMFRVNFTDDALKFSRPEVEQWMAYLSYAGVQHFFLYDNCQQESECQEWLQDDPRVSYTKRNSISYQRAQLSTYMEHWQSPDAQLSEFEIVLDIDEYPFMPNDREANFLVRFARKALREEDQVLLQTIFFGSQSGPDDKEHPWRVMRYLHRTAEVISSGRTKYLYRPEMVNDQHQHKIWGIHQLAMKSESRTQIRADKPGDLTVHRIKADPAVIRLNHYWCERMGADATVFDDSIRPLVQDIRKQET